MRSEAGLLLSAQCMREIEEQHRRHRHSAANTRENTILILVTRSCKQASKD